MAISVVLDRCPQNHPCPALRVCPVNALTQNGFSAPTVDTVKCIDCKKCVRFCPMEAFSYGLNVKMETESSNDP